MEFREPQRKNLLASLSTLSTYFWNTELKEVGKRHKDSWTHGFPAKERIDLWYIAAEHQE